MLIQHAQTQLSYLSTVRIAYTTEVAAGTPNISSPHPSAAQRSSAHSRAAPVLCAGGASEQHFAVMWSWLTSEGLPAVFFMRLSALSCPMCVNWPQNLGLGDCMSNTSVSCRGGHGAQERPSALSVRAVKDTPTAAPGYLYPRRAVQVELRSCMPC